MCTIPVENTFFLLNNAVNFATFNKCIAHLLDVKV